MAESNVLSLVQPPRKPDDDLIEELSELLELAKKGEVDRIVLVMHTVPHGWEWGDFGDTDDYQLIGRLLEVLLALALGQDDDE